MDPARTAPPEPHDPSSLRSPEPVPAALLQRLRRRPWEFDLFQAIWLLERYCGGPVRAGGRGPVALERLRFRPDPSLAFPATDLRSLTPVCDPQTGAEHDVLEIACLGLYGVSTPLPLHYAVDVLRATVAVANRPAPDGPPAPPSPIAAEPTRALLDVVNHRLIALLYRSWLKYRHERLFDAAERDAITVYLRCLIGCPPEVQAPDLGVPPIRLLRYAGLLTQHPRSAQTLGGLLSDWWDGISVRVTQWTGEWLPLDPADQNAIGRQNSRLGLDLTVGEQVYDLAGTFTVAVGPVDWPTFVTLTPGGARFKEACALTRLHAQDPLAFVLAVTLKADEVPELKLSSGPDAARLGYTSWVRTANLGVTTVTFSTEYAAHALETHGGRQSAIHSQSEETGATAAAREESDVVTDHLDSQLRAER